MAVKLDLNNPQVGKGNPLGETVQVNFGKIGGFLHHLHESICREEHHTGAGDQRAFGRNGNGGKYSSNEKLCYGLAGTPLSTWGRRQ